jgi:hypothetical protein
VKPRGNDAGGKPEERVDSSGSPRREWWRYVLAAVVGIPVVLLVRWGLTANPAAVGQGCGFIAVLAGAIVGLSGAVEKFKKTLATVTIVSGAVTMLASFASDLKSEAERLASEARLQAAVADAKSKLWDATTGGDSFAFVELHMQEPLRTGENVGLLQLFHRGKNPLLDLSLVIYDAAYGDNRKRTSFSLKRDFGTLLPRTGGFLTPESQTLQEAASPRVILNEDYIRFEAHFAARNGTWRQPLTARRVSGQWLTTTAVVKSGNYTGGDVILWEHTDDGFPREAGGEIKW